MTETTEEKVVSILEDTNTQLLNAEQIVKYLKAQVTSLTIENKELKENYTALQKGTSELQDMFDRTQERSIERKQKLKELEGKLKTLNLYYYSDDPECPDSSIEELMESADLNTPALVTPCVLIEQDDEWWIKKSDGSYPKFKTYEEALASLKSKREEE